MATSNPFTKLKEERATENPFTKLKEERESDPGAAAAFGLQTGRGLTDALLSVPAGIGQVVAQGVAGTEAALEGGASLLTGGEFDFNRRANRNLNDDILGTLNNLPRPTTNEVGAGIRSIPGLFGSQLITERFDDELALLEGDEAKLREQHPTATAAGDVGGDVASLFVGRQAVGMEEKMRRAENLIMNPRPDIYFSAARQVEKIKPGLMGVVEDAVKNNNAWRKLLKGAGRSAETGVEAVALDVLHGDNPSETAAWAAASQAGGSMTLAARQGLLAGSKGHVMTKLGIAGLVGTGAWQYFQQAVPGGTNSPFASVQKGFGEVLLMVAAGTLAGFAGGGRLRGSTDPKSLQLRSPKVAEAITSVPRGIVLSLIESLNDADPAELKQAEAALQIISTEPESLNKKAADALSLALDKGRFSDAVDDLMHDEEFAKLIFAITPPVLSNGN